MSVGGETAIKVMMDNNEMNNLVFVYVPLLNAPAMVRSDRSLVLSCSNGLVSDVDEMNYVILRN